MSVVMFMSMAMMNRLWMNWPRLTLNVSLMNCLWVDLMPFASLLRMNMGSMFAMNAIIRMRNLNNQKLKIRKRSSLYSTLLITYGMGGIMRLNMTSIALRQRCQHHNTCNQRDLSKNQNIDRKLHGKILNRYLTANLQ